MDSADTPPRPTSPFPEEDKSAFAKDVIAGLKRQGLAIAAPIARNNFYRAKRNIFTTYAREHPARGFYPGGPCRKTILAIPAILHALLELRADTSPAAREFLDNSARKAASAARDQAERSTPSQHLRDVEIVDDFVEDDESKEVTDRALFSVPTFSDTTTEVARPAAQPAAVAAAADDSAAAPRPAAPLVATLPANFTKYVKTNAMSDTQSKFWAPLVSIGHSLTPSSVLEVTEEVHYKTSNSANGDAPTDHPPITRTLILGVTAQKRPVKLQLKKGTGYMDSVRAAYLLDTTSAAFGSDGAPAPGKRIWNIDGYRNVKILSCSDSSNMAGDNYGPFPACVNVNNANGTQNEPLPDTAFPSLDGDVAHGADQFERSVIYKSLRLLSDADAAAARDAAASTLARADTDAASPGHNNKRWTAIHLVTPVSFEYDDDYDPIVEQHLADIHKDVPTIARATEGVMREHFASLSDRIWSQYSKALTYADRSRVFKRIVALPLMFMKRIHGSTRDRNLIEKTQMQCTVVTITGQKPPPREVAAVSDLQADIDAVKSAFAHIKNGHMSKASAAMSRTKPKPGDRKPMDEIVADLIKLHPRGPPADMQADLANMTLHKHKPGDITMTEVLAQIKSGHSAGSAAGPDAHTFSMMYDLVCADALGRNVEHNLRHILCDMMNNSMCGQDISPELARLIKCSWLVGLPKPGGGTRPLSMGNVLLKLASGRACAAACSITKKLFAGKQFGVRHPGGGEHIVHQVRRFLRSGEREGSGAPAGDKRCAVLMDLRNAFNKVFRQSMWEAVRNIPELVGLFSLSYGSEADLFVKGSDGAHQIPSQQGSRQGDAGGVEFFAIVLQPILDAISRIPGVTLYSFLDDATFLCEDEAVAFCVLQTFERMCTPLGMELNHKKCEIIYAYPPADSSSTTFPPAASPDNAFIKTDCVKLLGASIAMANDREAEHLLARYAAKHELVLRRAALGPSVQLLSYLRVCGLPRLNHVMRTHDPDVTKQLCVAFDLAMADIVAKWAGADVLSPTSLGIMQLPLKEGGLGLSSTVALRHAAFKASHDNVINGRLGGKPGKAPSQAQLSNGLTAQLRQQLSDTDAFTRRQLDANSADGADAFYNNATFATHSDVVGAALRTRLQVLLVAAAGMGELTCSGCSHSFTDQRAWAVHVTSCVNVAGNPPAHRHDTLNGHLRADLKAGGFNPEATEPRRFKIYKLRCKTGSGEMEYTDFAVHRETCSTCKGSVPLHTSGPDQAFTDDSKSGDTVGTGRNKATDLTIIEALVPTNIGKTTTTLFSDAIEKKNALYTKLCNDAGVTFEAHPALSNGHLSKPFELLLRKIADASFIERKVLKRKYCALIVAYTARARLAAERSMGIAPPSIHIDAHKSRPCAVPAADIPVVPGADASAATRRSPAPSEILSSPTRTDDHAQQYDAFYRQFFNSSLDTIAADVADRVIKATTDAINAAATSAAEEVRVKMSTTADGAASSSTTAAETPPEEAPPATLPLDRAASTGLARAHASRRQRSVDAVGAAGAERCYLIEAAKSKAAADSRKLDATLASSQRKARSESMFQTQILTGMAIRSTGSQSLADHDKDTAAAVAAIAAASHQHVAYTKAELVAVESTAAANRAQYEVSVARALSVATERENEIQEQQSMNEVTNSSTARISAAAQRNAAVAANDHSNCHNNRRTHPRLREPQLQVTVPRSGDPPLRANSSGGNGPVDAIMAHSNVPNNCCNNNNDNNGGDDSNRSAIRSQVANLQHELQGHRDAGEFYNALTNYGFNEAHRQAQRQQQQQHHHHNGATFNPHAGSDNFLGPPASNDGALGGSPPPHDPQSARAHNNASSNADTVVRSHHQPSQSYHQQQQQRSVPNPVRQFSTNHGSSSQNSQNSQMRSQQDQQRYRE